MSVLHINPDSASLEFHLKVAGPKFPPIGEFVRLLSIDVYGRPGNGLVEGLRQKAKLLGSGRVRGTFTPDLLACLRLKFSGGRRTQRSDDKPRAPSSATPSFCDHQRHHTYPLQARLEELHGWRRSRTPTLEPLGPSDDPEMLGISKDMTEVISAGFDEGF